MSNEDKKTTINDVIKECGGGPVEVIDATGRKEPFGTFESVVLPIISHDEAQAAATSVGDIKDRYNIDDEDMDMLYNLMLTVFLRGQYLLVQGFEPTGEEKS